MAFLEPTGNPKKRRFALECIAGKRVGYAVFDEDMQLIAAIELSHRSRVTQKEAALDACFVTAGIKTLRFYSPQLPSEEKIRSSIYTHAGDPAHYTPYPARHRKTPWRNTLNAHG